MATFLYLGLYVWFESRKYLTWQLLKIPQRQDGGGKGETSKGHLG